MNIPIILPIPLARLYIRNLLSIFMYISVITVLIYFLFFRLTIIGLYVNISEIRGYVYSLIYKNDEKL